MERLVVCADRTWESRDDSTAATNVEELADTPLKQRHGAHERTGQRRDAPSAG